MTSLRWIAAFLLASHAGLCAADIYKWVDEKGKTHFSDSASKRPGEQQVQLRGANSMPSVDAPTSPPVSEAPATEASRVDDVATAAREWARRHCSLKSVTLMAYSEYANRCTERESQVLMVCDRVAPRKFSTQVGRVVSPDKTQLECGTIYPEGTLYSPL